MKNENLPMALKLISIALLCSISILNCNRVKGKSSRKNDLDVEEELQFPKKSQRSSIRTDNGDVYDCVDFYKQPAFNHPLLKNIPSQTRSSYMPKTLNDKERKPLEIGLKGGGCPTGTIPILRSSKKKINKTRLSSKSVLSNMNPVGDNERGHHYAIVRTKSNPNKKFIGAESYISLHNPKVLGSQFSASQIKLSNGPDRIEAGWMVNIDHFKDNRTRLFAQFTAGGTQCFNLQCPGFVQVSSEVPLGLAATRFSVVGGATYSWKISISRDPFDGNWWLYFAEEKVKVGYWPKKIFTSLSVVASQAQWGGEVYSTGGQFPPQMGTGHAPVIHNIRYVANHQQIKVVDESFRYVNAEDTEMYMDGIYAYIVSDEGYQGDFLGHLILFGGAG